MSVQIREGGCVKGWREGLGKENEKQEEREGGEIMEEE